MFQRRGREQLMGTSHLAQVISEFRSFDPNIPAQVIQCFLEVALDPGLTPKELAVRTNISTSSASRNLQYLASKHRLGKAGLGLIEVRKDPVDWRRRAAYLSEDGERLIQSLERILV